MTWKLFTAVLFAVLATMLPPGGGIQDRRPEGGRDRRLTSDKDAAGKRMARNVETLRAMQGGWQLMELRAPDLPDPGRQDVGYMVVSDEFASIELHFAYFNDSGEETGSFIQTGIYRLNFNIYGDLVAKLLIGSVDAGPRLTQPREPGALSVYQARVTGNRVTFNTEDGTRLIFERMKAGVLTHLLYEDTEWLPRATEAAAEVDEKTEDDESPEDGPPEKGDR